MAACPCFGQTLPEFAARLGVFDDDVAGLLAQIPAGDGWLQVAPIDVYVVDVADAGALHRALPNRQSWPDTMGEGEMPAIAYHERVNGTPSHAAWLVERHAMPDRFAVVAYAAHWGVLVGCYVMELDAGWGVDWEYPCTRDGSQDCITKCAAHEPKDPPVQSSRTKSMPAPPASALIAALMLRRLCAASA